MAAKNASLGRKVMLAGAGVAAIATGIAAAVALSDEKNRKKVNKIAKQLKAKSEDVFEELKKLAEKAQSSKSKS